MSNLFKLFAFYKNIFNCMQADSSNYNPAIPRNLRFVVKFELRAINIFEIILDPKILESLKINS